MSLPPAVTYDAHVGQWFLAGDFASQPTSLIGPPILIPQGFETDLASVPRLFWFADSPFELSIGGAITHDWLYRHGGAVDVRRFSRQQADQFFLDFMKVEGVPWRKRTIAYHAVRIFGGSSWQSPPTE